MKRLTVCIGMLILVLSACTNSNLIPSKTIEKIIITRVDDGSTYRITNKKAINIFKNALTEIEEMNGVIRVKKQNYEVTFYFKDHAHKPIYMWLSRETGMAMDPEDVHITYSLKEENVEAIHALGIIDENIEKQ